MTYSPYSIFLIVYLAMLANSFWEAYVEGKHAWDRRKFGWKIPLGKYCLPAYHFYLFVIMWPLLLSLPLVIYGWNTRLFGILLSAYTSGLILEDFFWFVINPEVKLSDFNPTFASWYPWSKIGPLTLPTFYFLTPIFSLLSWYFLWRQ